MRVALTAGKVVLIVILFAVAGLSDVRAADTLGARVTSIVVTGDDPTLHVTNLGTVDETFAFTVPTGWVVTPATLTLAPGEDGSVTVTGSGDPAVIVVRGRPAVAVSGTDQSAIQFRTQVMTTRGEAPFTVPGWAFGLAIGLLALASVLRRLRPWEWRVYRAGGAS